MKLTGELKAKVESAEGMEEKKAILAEAGMELNDEELAAVAGGNIWFGDSRCECPKGGQHVFIMVDSSTRRCAKCNLFISDLT